MVVVDTNLILRWLLQDDPKSASKANSFWSEAMSGVMRAHIPEAILAECVFVLQHHYDIDRKAISSQLLAVIDLKCVHVDRVDVLRQALHEYSARPKISFIDALLLGCGMQERQPLATFDADLSRAARQLNIELHKFP